MSAYNSEPFDWGVLKSHLYRSAYDVLGQDLPVASFVRKLDNLIKALKDEFGENTDLNDRAKKIHRDKLESKIHEKLVALDKIREDFSSKEVKFISRCIAEFIGRNENQEDGNDQEIGNKRRRSPMPEEFKRESRKYSHVMRGSRYQSVSQPEDKKRMAEFLTDNRSRSAAQQSRKLASTLTAKRPTLDTSRTPRQSDSVQSRPQISGTTGPTISSPGQPNMTSSNTSQPSMIPEPFQQQQQGFNSMPQWNTYGQAMPMEFEIVRTVSSPNETTVMKLRMNAAQLQQFGVPAGAMIGATSAFFGAGGLNNLIPMANCGGGYMQPLLQISNSAPVAPSMTPTPRPMPTPAGSRAPPTIGSASVRPQTTGPRPQTVGSRPSSARGALTEKNLMILAKKQPARPSWMDKEPWRSLYPDIIQIDD